jgi:hypothetical protein
MLVEMGTASLYLAGLGGLRQRGEYEAGMGRRPLRPRAGGELPDFSTVAFIFGFRQSHMTAQHPDRVCLPTWPPSGHLPA